MSKRTTKWNERTDVASIFISLTIISILAFLTNNAGILYHSDIFVVLGMLVGSYFILKREELFKNRVKNILILAIIGGIVSGADLTFIAILLATAIKYAYQYPFQLLYLWIEYILITQIIIASIIIIYLYIKERIFFSANSKQNRSSKVRPNE